MPRNTGSVSYGMYSGGQFVRKEEWSFGSDGRRKRPTTAVGLLSQQTSHSAYRRRWIRGASGSNPDSASYLLASQFATDNATISKLKNLCVITLRNKMKEESINLPVFCGEFSDTAGLFVDIASRVTGAYKAFKRGHVRVASDLILGYKPKEARLWQPGWRRQWRTNRAAARAAQTVGNHHLAMRYGVLPMAYDLQAGLEEIYRSDFFRDGSAIFTAKATTSGNFAAGGGSLRLYSSNLLQTSHITVRTKIHYKVVPGFDAAKRFGITNPLSAGYELIPLSFVLDWFIPVGDYLASLDALVGTTIIGVHQSVVRQAYEMRQQWHSPSRLDTPSHFWASEYTRTTAVDLSVSPPGYRPSLSFMRIMDALALARGAFKK